jgi:hypothetical protein
MIGLPPRLRRRPLDKRGLIIPFVQFIDTNGEPNFAALDHDRVALCLLSRRCGLCGQPMGRHVHFVGGPLCVINRYFYDPPMHKECAIYALETCPHLARSKGRYREAPESLDGAKIIVGQMDVTRKVEYFALMHAVSYHHGRTEDGMLVVRAGPWVDVEYWKDGRSVGNVPPLKESHDEPAPNQTGT